MLFPLSFPPFRWSPRLHWPWLAALALLCFSLSIYLLELPALRAQNDGLAQQIHILETQLRVPQKAALHDPSLDLNKQLASFDRLTIIVKDLHTLATQNGLNLSEASYKLMDDGAGRKNADPDDIGRIEIQARLSGNYVPLKSGIANLLAAHDGLALESLSLRRNRSTDLAMEIDLRLSFLSEAAVRLRRQQALLLATLMGVARADLPTRSRAWTVEDGARCHCDSATLDFLRL